MKNNIGFLTHGDRNIGGGEHSWYLLITNICKLKFKPIIIYSVKNKLIKKLISDDYLCHKININDQIIICTYCMLKDNEYVNHKPTIIYVDELNNIIDKPVNKKINAV